MKRILILFAVLLAVNFNSNCFATILTFDDLSLGVRGDNFKYGEVVFSTYPGSHLQVTDQTADGFGNAHSLQNKLSVWGDQPLVPKEKTSIQLIFDSPVMNFNFWLTGTFHETTINAYDEDGNLVMFFIQTYPMDGPTAPDGKPWDYYYDRVMRHVTLNAINISKISIQPSAYDGFSIDDVSYEKAGINPVPEPSTIFLLGSTILGLLIFQRLTKYKTANIWV